jgi:hypothetical protein
LGLAPGLLRLWRQMTNAQAFWLEQPTPGEALATLADVLLPSGFWRSPYVEAPEQLLRLATGGLAILLVALALRQRKPLMQGPIVLIVLAWLALPVAIWLAGFVAAPTFMDRSLVFALPGFALAAAALIDKSKAPLVAALVVTGVYLTSTVIAGPMRDKEDFRGAARYLAAHAQAGDVIALCSMWTYPPLRYHAEQGAAASVVGFDYSGRIVQLETALGANPDWTASFVRAESGPAAPSRVEIAPGRSIWRLDVYCADEAASLAERSLAGLALEPAFTQRVDGEDWLVVRRYRPDRAVSWVTVVPPGS